MSKSGKKSSDKEEEKKAKPVPPKSRSTGKTPKQVMNKHIRDKNDVITEEDFKNLHIGIDVTDETDQPPLDISNDTKRPKDEDKDPKMGTPWTLIDT